MEGGGGGGEGVELKMMVRQILKIASRQGLAGQTAARQTLQVASG